MTSLLATAGYRDARLVATTDAAGAAASIAHSSLPLLPPTSTIRLNLEKS